MDLTINKTIPLEDFDTWIMSDAWTIENTQYPVRCATLHPILHFLQDANRMDPANGKWRLWDKVDPTAERALAVKQEEKKDLDEQPSPPNWEG